MKTIVLSAIALITLYALIMAFKEKDPWIGLYVNPGWILWIVSTLNSELLVWIVPNLIPDTWVW